MIEVPEHDDRHSDVGKAVDIHLECLGLHAVTAGSLEHVGGVGTVSADATGFAELLEGHVPTVITQQDAQCGSAALDCLHLDQRRCPGEPATWNLQRLGRGHHRRITQSIGRSSASVKVAATELCDITVNGGLLLDQTNSPESF